MAILYAANKSFICLETALLLKIRSINLFEPWYVASHVCLFHVLVTLTVAWLEVWGGRGERESLGWGL